MAFSYASGFSSSLLLPDKPEIGIGWAPDGRLPLVLGIDQITKTK
jgi:hypothetical protein